MYIYLHIYITGLGLTCSETMKLAAVDSSTVVERSAQLPSDEKDEQEDADTWYDTACTQVHAAFRVWCAGCRVQGVGCGV